MISQRRAIQDRIDACRNSVCIWIEDIEDARYVAKRWPHLAAQEPTVEQMIAGLARCRAKLAALEAEQRRA